MSSKSKKLPASLEPVPATESTGQGTATATSPAPAPAPIPVPVQPPTEPVTAVAPVTTVSAALVASPPDSVSKALSKPKSKPKPSKKCLDLGAGYSISVNEGSAYHILLKLMAKKGHFADVVAALDVVNPSDKAQARTALSKVMVSREDFEEYVRQDSNWDAHAQSRIKNLKVLAKSSKTAEATLANKERVKGSKWVGNIREILGVCASSYPKSKNRNTHNFEEAGVVFRVFREPSKDPKTGAYFKLPKRSNKVFLMMFPSKYINTVRACIETVHGIKEPRK